MGAHQIFPQHVVLGTSTIPYFWAVAPSMGVLALIGTFAMPFVHEIENWRGSMFTPQEWTIAYFVVNFVALWGITRFAEQFGLGMSAWYVVGLVALLIDLVQGGAMMQLGKSIQK